MDNFTSIYLSESINEPSAFYEVMRREVGADVSEGEDWVNVETGDPEKVARAVAFLREAGFSVIQIGSEG